MKTSLITGKKIEPKIDYVITDREIFNKNSKDYNGLFSVRQIDDKILFSVSLLNGLDFCENKINVRIHNEIDPFDCSEELKIGKDEHRRLHRECIGDTNRVVISLSDAGRELRQRVYKKMRR